VIEDADAKVASAGGNLSKIEVVAQPVEVEVTSDVQKRELAGSRIERRSKVSCSNSSQSSFISARYGYPFVLKMIRPYLCSQLHRG